MALGCAAVSCGGIIYLRTKEQEHQLAWTADRIKEDSSEDLLEWFCGQQLAVTHSHAPRRQEAEEKNGRSSMLRQRRSEEEEVEKKVAAL